MESYPVKFWPTLSEYPSAGEYFWHQFPYSLPGFLTFIVGFVLFTAAIARLRYSGNRNLFLSFAISCLAFGTLGLLLGLRAVIPDESLLVALNTELYPIVLLFTPMSCHLVDEILENRYKSVRWAAWLNWAAAGLALIGILMDRAFTGEFIQYSFGKYPVSSGFLKPWGIIGVMSYFVVVVPAYYDYLKDNSLQEKWTLAIGHNLLIILSASNLPSLIGVPLFPGGNFSFIPMLILAYGVFRNDFLNLSVLLFQKSILFYFLNVIIACIFFTISAVVIRLLTPADLAVSSGALWLFVPILSALAVFGLGILVGGTNPGSPLNQLGAFSLFIFGAQLISNIVTNLSSGSLASYRITQLCYAIFCLAPCIQIRFACVALKRSPPRWLFIFDFSSILLSFLSFSPWLLVGYYEFPWGRILASGPVIQVFGAVAFLGLIMVGREWKRAGGRKGAGSIGNFAVLFLVLSAIMLFLNLPATTGIPIYPLGNLTILPTAILAYGVLKYGGDSREHQALRVGHRISLLSLLMIPIVLFLVFPLLPDGDAPAFARTLYIFLFGLPILLLGYQLTFFLTRPISTELDATFESLATAKEIAEETTREVENLNEFARLLNSTLNLDKLFRAAFDFMIRHTNIDTIWLMHVQKETGILEAYARGLVPPSMQEEDINFFKQLRVPLNQSGGTLYQTFIRMTPFYLEEIPTKRTAINVLNGESYKLSKIDFQITMHGRLQSLLQIPLILNNEVIGILNLTAYDQKLSLTEKEILRIVRICEQITGALYSARLIAETQEAHRAAEKARQETESLNGFTRRINASNELNLVIDEIFSFIQKNFGINSCILSLLAEKRKTLRFQRAWIDPEEWTESQREYFENLEIPLDETGGTLWRTFCKKQPFYLPRTNFKIPHPLDKQIIDTLELASLLIVPLVVQNRTIGIIWCTSGHSRMNLSRSDIDRVQAFCDQIAGAIRNTYLFDQTESARKDIEALNEFAIRINETGNLDTVLDLVFKHTEENFGIRDGVLWVVDSDKDILYPRRFSPGIEKRISQENLNWGKNLRIRLEDECALTITYRRLRTLYVSDVNRWARYVTEIDRGFQEHLGNSAFLQIPLLIQGKVVAIMAFTAFDESWDLSKDEIASIERFCTQIAGAVHSTHLFQETEAARQKTDSLLLNILPAEVAGELKEKGEVRPILYESATILFTDFKGFTTIAELMSPADLIRELDGCFSQFDEIVHRFNLEKLKTIGDSYMCVGGLPARNQTHAIDACLAALEFQAFMNQMQSIKKELGLPFWEMRLGIHSGPVIAGVIGKKKFAFDVWGDAVNTASRLESAGEPGKINISQSTYELIKDFFKTEYRGTIPVKNKGEVAMHFLLGLRDGLTIDNDGQIPNKEFQRRYLTLKEAT
ncbi:adenylate/guanylate cyclase catalytic domain protein [Leptospira inadai serovar Lyme str. 10]|uniref:Adenylate/guanylate cyclase catalytic domain protein n=2 Tax=Leptospira inadai serovar Lyme TaxID=293084 RepID=V6HM97_9LEPT|nr:adenylate/guanylate cyclase domain-containing protein [Leptospira inadai]EQA38010.1 adenylate/guanylate cyclase catalytic domain protein [Leptospira inadai serovar Lyme str. 10]PNV73581.1 hypothetical protein BES34_016855 [Leptospira inadai serovar Lyme]